MGSVLVTGGTGVLGRAVVAGLLADGHRVRIASRRPEPAGAPGPVGWARVDYRDGAGLAGALAGVDTVVHCAGGLRATAERSLVAHAAGAHLVYVSIVGVDRVPLSYYRRKLAAERMIERSGVPHTILRTTQFHDLIRLLLAALSRPPVRFVPDLRFQPVDVATVAARLARLAAGPPIGRAPDLGGPEIRRLTDLAEVFAEVTGRRRPTVPVRLPGRTFAGLRAGGHLAPGHAAPGRTFADYLAAHPDPAGLSYQPAPGRPG